MERKQPISVIYRTADQKRKTGGQRKELKGVILHGQDWENSTRKFTDPTALLLIKI
jgi:hypothetical protein